MNFRIRTKFIGILVIASILPLAITLGTLHWFSEKNYRKAQGALYKEAALHLSDSISQSIHHEIEILNSWSQSNRIPELTKDLLPTEPNQTANGLTTIIQAIEAKWLSNKQSASTLESILNNPLAQSLRELQAYNPEFAEIFITDLDGRLVAATHKISDYFQADEMWWNRAVILQPGMVNVEGLNYDESAEVYSIDISFPLHGSYESQPKVIGVLKCVVHTTPTFQRFTPLTTVNEANMEVITSNGDVLANIHNTAFKPFTKKIRREAASYLHGVSADWSLIKVDSNTPAIFAFAPIRLNTSQNNSMIAYGLSPMWAVVYCEDATVMAPMYARLRNTTLLGLAFVVGFSGIGYFIASSQIIAPITKLRLATEAVSQSVRLEDSPQNLPVRHSPQEIAALLTLVESIQSKDEIGELASEFSFMAKRILNYQGKLESEIASKTQAIQRDLEFAREFQSKLMPQATFGKPEFYGLNIHHIYQPASSVGGDFFDVLKLGDSKVGIFIADVMGHGVRSALITAILATLIQDIKNSTHEPEIFLKVLNIHFHRILRGAGEVIFASAFYLVLDLDNQTAAFASAGHPSPLLLDRSTDKVVPLTPNLSNNPALGLFPESTYDRYTRQLNDGDRFLLFTDGAFECSDASGVEFGQDRLKMLLSKYKKDDLETLITQIVHSITQHSQPHGLDDDVCLVGVEFVRKTHSPII